MWDFPCIYCNIWTVSLGLTPCISSVYGRLQAISWILSNSSNFCVSGLMESDFIGGKCLLTDKIYLIFHDWDFLIWAFLFKWLCTNIQGDYFKNNDSMRAVSLKMPYKPLTHKLLIHGQFISDVQRWINSLYFYSLFENRGWFYSHLKFKPGFDNNNNNIHISHTHVQISFPCHEKDNVLSREEFKGSRSAYEFV